MQAANRLQKALKAGKTAFGGWQVSKPMHIQATPTHNITRAYQDQTSPVS